MKTLSKAQKQSLLASIRDIPDYPKPGILFKDITTLLNDAKQFNFLMEHLADFYKDKDIDFIAGIESRGFIFGSALSVMLELPFVPIRKPGKLPFTTVSEKYSLEYGFDEVEIHIDALKSKERKNVLLIDDLIATGGTAKASVSLINKIGGNCIGACFIINLLALQGAKDIEKLTNVYSVLEV
ncbi:MAG: adenine phosphoribosyltransferase [Proteobacteria bacterium]|nr:MAG: adenine phosphoribosyltransferase [Pseudomonadota bacterium]